MAIATQPRPTLKRSTLKRLLPELRPFLHLQLICMVLTIIRSALGFLPPLILGTIVNRLQNGEPVQTVLYLTYIVGAALGAGLAQYALGIYTAKLGQGFLIATRQKLYRHMQSLPVAYFDKNQPGKLVSNVINDAATVQGLITTHLNELILDTTQLSIVLFALFWIDWRLALLSFIIAPFYVLSFRRTIQPLRDRSNDIRATRDVMYGDMQEKLTGIEVVKGFGQERTEAMSFLGTTKELLLLNVEHARLSGKLWTVADGWAGVGQGLVLLAGGFLCLRGEMGAGTLVMFMMYSITYVYGPVTRFLMVLGPFARAQAAMDRIFRTLDTPSSIADKDESQPMPPIRGQVDIEGVWFEYLPGVPVLKNMNLHVEPGQMIALVGFSGSGKTTLVNLLMRHYDPTEGRIRVDGYDLRDVQLRSYREQIGYVIQESVVFNATVLDNIRYGRPTATEEEARQAAIAANLHATIEALPEGYDTKLGEAGVSLSVGEKQRLSIARALLADPKILILDEATSALDSQTEALLQQALERLLKGRTSFVIAHRLSTIVQADVILVMEGGVVTERGRHHELLEKGGLYSRLYEQQFGVALKAGSGEAP